MNVLYKQMKMSYLKKAYYTKKFLNIEEWDTLKIK